MVDYAAIRFNMVASQLRTNRVTDTAILEAFETVPRERFVPEAQRSIAYVDEDIPLGGGRHLMEPMVLARLLQAAAPQAHETALDVACGTGFATFILGRLSATAVGLESDPALAASARRTLGDLGADNTLVVEGPLTEGYAKQAPYNVILLNGAVAEVPYAIREQLAEGGRLVAVIKDADGVGRATLMQRTGDVVSGRVLFDAAIPLLPDFARPPAFVF
jgi:protein-L-isoaspartate(D-aspartate) O-methyltransferase